MPENCYLYKYRQVGFLCDGFSVEVSQACPGCGNKVMRSVSQSLFALSIGFLFLPFVIFYLKKPRNSFDIELQIFSK